MRPAAAESAKKSGAFRAIVIAGVIAGVLDLVYVLIFYGLRGIGAPRILQSITAGLLGRDAAGKGGWGAAALGLALHFAIALSVAAIFYALSRKLRFLVTRPIVGGMLYGAGVWLFMNLVVLPLSATPPRSFPPAFWVPVLIAHLLCVGLPIAFTIRRWER